MGWRTDHANKRTTGSRYKFGWRKSLVVLRPSSDPWMHTEDYWFTTLEDVGVHPGQNTDWSEVEDWDLAPLRPVINGRKDYTPPTPHRARVMRPIDGEFKEDLDLVSERDLVAEFGVALKTVETWTASPDFPRAYGYRVDATRNWSGEALLYDRIDVYEWIEGTHPELTPFEEE